MLLMIRLQKQKAVRMNYKHRSTHRQVDEIDKKIMREIESLRELERYSSRVQNKAPTHNTQGGSSKTSKVLQIKPSSRGQKAYVVSELKIGNSSQTQGIQYGESVEMRKSNKENIARNPMNNLLEYNKKKPVNYSKMQKHSSSIKSHLKTETSTKQDELDYYPPANPNHYVSANVINDNLFENYDLSNSGGSDELFPEDSLNFSLKEDIPRDMERNGRRENKGVKKDFLDLGEVGNDRGAYLKKEGMRKKENEALVEYTFKPTILDKSKEIAERLGSSYTRLIKSKNTTKQNTYRQNPSKTKAYSRQRLNTLSKPRVIVPTQPEEEMHNQCTFKPVLSKKSLNHFNGCYLDIIERNALWENQRQQKLQKLRESSEQIKNQRLRLQCSAVKIKNKYNPNQEVAFSRFGKDGLIEYFERVNQVNETKKREKEVESKFSGKGWNGEVTKPQEFRLSSNSPNELSYRSRGKSVMVNSVGNNPVEREYQRAVKEVHDKIRQLNLMI